MSQTDIISRCLNGDCVPYCNRCPAHHSQNGECCFGLRFEYPHSDCNGCVIRVDCAAQTQAFSQQGYPTQPTSRPGAPRVYYPPTQTIRQPGQPVRVMTRYEAPQPQYRPPAPMQYNRPQYMQPPPEAPAETDLERPWLQRVGYFLAHGMAESFVEGVLYLLRQSRPW